jgi:hypothetical protein
VLGLVSFIQFIAPAIYIFCAAAFLYGLYQFIRARRHLAVAEFDLVEELWQGRQARAVTLAIGAIEIALATVAIAFVVQPTMRNDLLSGGIISAQPTPEVFATIAPDGNGQATIAAANQTAAASSGLVGPSIIQTAVNTPTPVGTIIDGYPTPSDCPRDQAWLEVPAPGQFLFDSVTVTGVANIPNFAQYKLEVSGPGLTDNIYPILTQFTLVASKGTLGQIPLSGFTEGRYSFRLAVFDTNNELKATCTVQVLIGPRPNTPTPLGS